MEELIIIMKKKTTNIYLLLKLGFLNRKILTFGVCSFTVNWFILPVAEKGSGLL